MDTQAQNLKLVTTLYELFNAHDWQGMAALYQDPAEFKDPSFGPEITLQTRQQITEKYSQMGETFPDLRDDLVQIYPSGDNHVIVEFISSGTAPDGTKWALPICTIFEIRNNLIQKDFTYYNASE